MSTVPPFRAEPLLGSPKSSGRMHSRGGGMAADHHTSHHHAELLPTTPFPTTSTSVVMTSSSSTSVVVTQQQQQQQYATAHSPSPTRVAVATTFVADSVVADTHTTAAIHRIPSKSPVPCVAHDHYTFHKNCGCHPSPVMMVKAPPAASARHGATRAISPPSSLRAQSVGLGRLEALGVEDCVDATSTLAIADASVIFFAVQDAHNGLHSTVFSLELLGGRTHINNDSDVPPHLPEYAIVERDVLSSRRYARHHAPLRRLCASRNEPAAPEADVVPTSMALVGWDHLWVGMSDGSILSWRKTASGDTAADNVVLDDLHPPASSPSAALSMSALQDEADSSAIDDGRRSPPLHSKHSVSSPDGRRGMLEGPTVLCHWSRVLSPHAAPIISMLVVPSPTSPTTTSQHPVDAVYTICSDGVVYRWSQGRRGRHGHHQQQHEEYDGQQHDEYLGDDSDADGALYYTPVLPWRPTVIAAPRGLAATAARCATVLGAVEYSSVTSTMEHLEVLAVGLKSGSTYVWRLRPRVIEDGRSDDCVPAKLEPTAEEHQHTSPAKPPQRKSLSPAASRKNPHNGAKHVTWAFGGVSAVCMIPSMPALITSATSSSFGTGGEMALAVGHDNGSVALWVRTPKKHVSLASEGTSAAVLVEENVWCATSVFDPKCMSPVCSLALVSSVKLWCLSLSGECVVLDLQHMEERTRRRVWRGVNTSTGRRVSPKRATGGTAAAAAAVQQQPWCAAQLNHVQFVSGHVLWATGRNDGALTTMFVPTTSSAVQSAGIRQHNHDFNSSREKLGEDPSYILENRSFAPNDGPPPPDPLLAEVELDEFERLERQLNSDGHSADKPTPAVPLQQQQQEPIAAQGYLAFVSQASIELEDVQARLDEHMVLLHDVMENQFQVLRAMRSQKESDVKDETERPTSTNHEDRIKILEDLLVAKDASMDTLKDELTKRDARIAALEGELALNNSLTSAAAVVQQRTSLMELQQHLTTSSSSLPSVSPNTPHVAGEQLQQLAALQQQLYDKDMMLQNVSIHFSQQSAEYERTISTLRAELEQEQMTSQQIMCDMQETIEAQEALEAKVASYETDMKEAQQALASATLQFDASKGRYKEALLNVGHNLGSEKSRADMLEQEVQQVQDLFEAAEEENRNLRERIAQITQARELQASRELQATPPSAATTLIRRRSRRETPGDEFRRFLAEKTQSEKLLDTIELALTQLASGAALALDRAAAAELEAREAVAAAVASHPQPPPTTTGTAPPSLNGANSNSVCSRNSTVLFHGEASDRSTHPRPPTAPESLTDGSEREEVEHRSASVNERVSVDSEASKQKLEELMKRCELLEGKLAAEQSETEVWQEQFAGAAAEVEALRIENSRLSTEMEDQFAEQHGSVQALIAERATLRAELDRVLESQHTLTQTHQREKMELISRTTGETTDLGERYAAAVKELDSLRPQLLAAEVHVQMLHDRNILLNTEAETCNAQYARQRTDMEVELFALRRDRDDAKSAQASTANELTLATEALQRMQQVLTATQESHDPEQMRVVLENALKDRDAAVALSTALKNELAQLTTSEHAMRRAADELALRVAVCEQEVGTWQAKASDAEERYRRDQVDMVTAQSLAEQLRLREKEAQEESWDVRRQLHEHVQLGKEALEAEVRLRSAVENKTRDLEAQLRRMEGHWSGQVTITEEASRALQEKVSSQAEELVRLETEVRDLHLVLASHGGVGNGSAAGGLGSNVKVASQIQQLRDENASLRIHVSELEHLVIHVEDAKKRHAKEILALKSLLSSHTELMSTLSPKPRKQRLLGRPSESPIKRSPYGRDVSGQQVAITTITSPAAKDPNGPQQHLQGSSKKKSEGQQTPQQRLQRYHHHHHHHDGPHDIATCVWCANLTVKSMGGTFGVCNDNPHRLQEFQHSASAGHPSSQPQSHSVSPIPRGTSTSSQPPPPPHAVASSATPSHQQRSNSAIVMASTTSTKPLERISSASSAVLSFSSTLAPLDLPLAPAVVGSAGLNNSNKDAGRAAAEGSLAVRELYFSSLSHHHPHRQD